eukprot:g13393.t2
MHSLSRDLRAVVQQFGGAPILTQSAPSAGPHDSPGTFLEEVMAILMEALAKVMFKGLADPTEACREAAIHAVTLFVEHVSDLTPHLAYLFPILMARGVPAGSLYDPSLELFVHDNEQHEAYKRGRATERQDRHLPVVQSMAEGSEELRLSLCRMVGRMLITLMERGTVGVLRPYLDDTILLLVSQCRDPYSTVTVEALSIITKLVLHPHLEQGMKFYAVGLSRAILPHLRHRHAKVRLAAIQALRMTVKIPDRAKVKGAGTSAIVDLVGFREDNVLPVAAFYGRGDTTVNYLAELTTDRSVSVRTETTAMLSDWLTSLPDRYDHQTRLLPYVLNAIADDAKPLLVEMSNWISTTRLQSALLFRILVVYCEEHLTVETHKLIPYFQRALHLAISAKDKHLEDILLECCELVGRYVVPESYLPHILSRIKEEPDVNPTGSRSTLLLILWKLMEGSLPKVLALHMPEIIDVVTARVEDIAGEAAPVRDATINVIFVATNSIEGCGRRTAEEAAFANTGRLASMERPIQSALRYLLACRSLISSPVDVDKGLRSLAAAGGMETVEALVSAHAEKLAESICEDFPVGPCWTGTCFPQLVLGALLAVCPQAINCTAAVPHLLRLCKQIVSELENFPDHDQEQILTNPVGALLLTVDNVWEYDEDAGQSARSTNNEPTSTVTPFSRREKSEEPSESYSKFVALAFPLVLSKIEDECDSVRLKAMQTLGGFLPVIQPDITSSERPYSEVGASPAVASDRKALHFGVFVEKCVMHCTSLASKSDELDTLLRRAACLDPSAFCAILARVSTISGLSKGARQWLSDLADHGHVLATLKG